MANDYYQILKGSVKKGTSVFIANSATVLGEITLGDNVSVWYGAVIRADKDSIHIGDRTNIQDGVIIHTDPGKPVTIGKEVTIGHGAVVHGCEIGDHSLIGIRSTILNDAKIGKCCIIGANALVTERMEVPDYSMVLGVPGKVVRQLPPEIIDRLKRSSASYVKEASKYLTGTES